MLSKLARLAFLTFVALVPTSAAVSGATSIAPVALPSIAPATAPAIAPAPVLYRLDAASAYSEGCIGPCLCPVWFTDDLVGTMVVTFNHADPNGYDYYDVTKINWVIGYGAYEQRITGRGRYRVGGQFAVMHQLELSLSTDGGPLVHFDSGLMVGGGAFPNFDIAVALPSAFCFQRTFMLSTSPVPVQEILPYRLRGAEYTEGCLAPCKCAIASLDAAGVFGLVDLGPASNPAFLHYALVDIRWRTIGAPTVFVDTFDGYGMYSIDAVGVEQRLVCDLTDNGGTKSRFDSGVVKGGFPGVPLLDIDIAVNGFYCYDMVFYVQTQP